jgi:hypothetical protein
MPLPFTAKSLRPHFQPKPPTAQPKMIILKFLLLIIPIIQSIQAQGIFEHETLGNVSIIAAYEETIDAAKSFLAVSPPSITYSPVKGLDHLFYSQANYWWPDPRSETGLPYIRIDGKVNPNAFEDHRLLVKALQQRVAYFGAAYVLTNKTQFLKNLRETLIVFFCNPDTLMLPDLSHAQDIPGMSREQMLTRSWGVLDGLAFSEVAVTITKLSDRLPKTVLNILKRWFAALLDWLLASPQGLAEFNASNNHGVAYFVQVSTYARLLKNQSAINICKRAYKSRFLMEMDADGSFPLELARTRPYHYSFYQLDMLGTLAFLLGSWNVTVKGRSMSKAVAHHAPFLDTSIWPLPPDIEGWESNPSRSFSVMYEGLLNGNLAYVEQYAELPHAGARLVTHPLLWI